MLAVIFEVAVAILFVVFVVHGLRRYAYRRFVYTIVLLGALMWLQEFSAQTLTGAYCYSGFSVMLANTPLAIVLAWIMASYVAFQVMLRTSKPFLGACIGASVDFALEPLAFYCGLWTWKTPPFPDLLYFTAPFANLLGWLFWCYCGSLLFGKILKPL